MWRGFAFLGIVAVVAILLKINSSPQPGSISPAESAGVPAPVAQIPAPSPEGRAEIVAAAKAADALYDRFWEARAKRAKQVTVAEIDKVEPKLRQLPLNDPEHSAVTQAISRLQSIRDHFDAATREAAEKTRVANDALGRKTYARTVEENFFKQYQDVSVSTEGEKGTTLRIKYVLINRPFVYNFQNNQEITENLRKRGFKKVILWDGFNNSWTLTY